MIYKKTLLSILILSFSSAAFSSDQYVVRVTKELNIGEWNVLPAEHSEWQDVSGAYDCTSWSPEPITVDYGVTYKQSQACSHDMERFTYIYQENSISKEKVLISESTEYDTQKITTERDEIGTKIVRNMCVDILARGDSVGNGVYSVDPDGNVGSTSPRNAYCDMSGGGWTLYDGFGTKLVLTGGNTPTAYNYKGINSISTINAAGYSYYLTTVNTPNYTTSPYYMQFFYGSSPIGYIRKTMPSWVKATKVVNTNQWYGGTSETQYGSSIQRQPSWGGKKEFVFNGSSTLTLRENGIYWIDSVWVK